jgi:AcrR family transcriptional regulator
MTSLSDPMLNSTVRVVDPDPRGRREAILDAATTLFSEVGFNDADTQALTDRLGIGKGTLYRCFVSKRELFLAAVDRVMRRLHEQIDASTKEIEDPLECISHGIRAYLQFFAAHPEYVELLIQERALFKDRKKPTYFEYRDRHAHFWRNLYQSLIDSERVRAIPVDQIRSVISQLLYGTVFTNFFNGQEKSSDVQAREIIDIFFRGILTEAGRESLASGSLDLPTFTPDLTSWGLTARDS